MALGTAGNVASFRSRRAESLRSVVSSVRVIEFDGMESEVTELTLAKFLQGLIEKGEKLGACDATRLAGKIFKGVSDGVKRHELDDWAIQTAAMMIGEDPAYSALAARMLMHTLEALVLSQGIGSFSESLERGYQRGLIASTTRDLVANNAAILNSGINKEQDQLFEYFGLRTVFDRYLLKDPVTREVLETPQYFFMRVACGLSREPLEALEFYRLLSSFEYMPSTPTLFNAATVHPQMSSC